jgi:mannose-6-phosphate isomerase-like protein (cupin superfamily)
MKAISRRDLCGALSFFFVGTGSLTRTKEWLPLEFEKRGKATLSTSEVFAPERISATTGANGAKRWDILQGVLATGESIAVHESLQPTDVRPNPPHTIKHSEIILVQEGILLFEYDGKSEKIGAGGVILVTPGTRHTAKNVGNGPARYLVIAIGGDTR